MNKDKNGRWNPDEHQRFIDGLKLYGKNWKKIREYIGTRTPAQIRSHAQKYFLKLKSFKKKNYYENNGGVDEVIRPQINYNFYNFPNILLNNDYTTKLNEINKLDKFKNLIEQLKIIIFDNNKIPILKKKCFSNWESIIENLQKILCIYQENDINRLNEFKYNQILNELKNLNEYKLENKKRALSADFLSKTKS